MTAETVPFKGGDAVVTTHKAVVTYPKGDRHHTITTLKEVCLIPNMEKMQW